MKHPFINTEKESRSTDKKKPKLGSGIRFARLKEKISKGYEKKGMGEEKAEEIAGATAAKIGRAKYGNKKMTNWAKKGRKKSG